MIWMGCCLFSECGYSQGDRGGNLNRTADRKDPVVVELFTSEGCSSCPAADALMPVIKTQFMDNVIILSFHVDYWNRLGWKDVYSSSEYTDRQRQYAAAAESDNVYTPQAIVNGTKQIVGNDAAGLTALIAESPRIAKNFEMSIAAHKQNEREIAVSYTANLEPNQMICIALVQVHATTKVTRGENNGRTLQHYNVVRDFRSVRTKNRDNNALTSRRCRRQPDAYRIIDPACTKQEDTAGK